MGGWRVDVLDMMDGRWVCCSSLLPPVSLPRLTHSSAFPHHCSAPRTHSTPSHPTPPPPQTLVDLLPTDPAHLLYHQVLVVVVNMQSGVSDIPHQRYEEAKKRYSQGGEGAQVLRGAHLKSYPYYTLSP